MMLEVIGLAKRFRGFPAVKNISFSIGEGESVGLLGPNGAGKTTTVSLICDLIKPDFGRILFGGRPFLGDSDRRKGEIGLVPQELALIDELSAEANLQFFGAMQGLSGRAMKTAIGRCLGIVELTTRSKDSVRTFSGGMKRRLNLAAALLHEPRLLILDEPTVGVDPQSRNAIFEALEALKSQGVSLLYTTHYMEEAERLCDRLVIVDHGEVVAGGDLAELSKLHQRSQRIILEVQGAISDDLLTAISQSSGVIDARVDENCLMINLGDFRKTAVVLDHLTNAGLAVSQITSEQNDLESIFLNLTGRGMRD